MAKSVPLVRAREGPAKTELTVLERLPSDRFGGQRNPGRSTLDERLQDERQWIGDKKLQKLSEVTLCSGPKRGCFPRKFLSILVPDVVVFLSGPRYDRAIQNEFPDMKISPISRRRSASTIGVVQAMGLPLENGPSISIPNTSSVPVS